jgi:hypothetical protein
MYESIRRPALLPNCVAATDVKPATPCQTVKINALKKIVRTGEPACRKSQCRKTSSSIIAVRNGKSISV